MQSKEVLRHADDDREDDECGEREEVSEHLDGHEPGKVRLNVRRVVQLPNDGKRAQLGREA